MLLSETRVVIPMDTYVDWRNKTRRRRWWLFLTLLSPEARRYCPDPVLGVTSIGDRIRIHIGLPGTVRDCPGLYCTVRFHAVLYRLRYVVPYSSAFYDRRVI